MVWPVIRGSELRWGCLHIIGVAGPYKSSFSIENVGFRQTKHFCSQMDEYMQPLAKVERASEDTKIKDAYIYVGML